MGIDSIRSWFNLKSVPGVGNLLCKRLIDRFKSPESVFQAAYQELIQIDGLTERQVVAIKNHKMADSVKGELELVAKRGYRIVTLTDSNYPRLLREIPDPPPFLYVYGRLEGGSAKLAVVGSRNPTDYGITSTRDLCESLTAYKLTIVSGMARGIDTAAHEGALASKGKTVAVLGSGLERIYPAENRQLCHQIAENGAVVSEFPLMARPEAHHFPIRNRVISGMSLGTVVVEATKKSGSLITARLAAEQNREVFAVPGSIQSFKSTGTHTLIKQGAKLVEHAQDIVEELAAWIQINEGPQTEPTGKTEVDRSLLSEDEILVFNELDPYPVHIDNLSRKIPMDTGKLSSVLLKLELDGLVHQAPGKLFSICEKFEAEGRSFSKK